jgi:hypothetical protein
VFRERLVAYPPRSQSRIGDAMSDQRPDDGGLSCLACGGCLSLFVIVASLVFVAVAGTDWLPQAVAAAVVVAFLIGIVAMERERRAR